MFIVDYQRSRINTIISCNNLFDVVNYLGLAEKGFQVVFFRFRQDKTVNGRAITTIKAGSSVTMVIWTGIINTKPGDLCLIFRFCLILCK
jgi:hypothetical protein